MTSYQNLYNNKNSKNEKYNKVPATATDLFQVLFVGLKLANIITWSWWLVFTPYLASFVIAAIIGGVVGYLDVIKK